MPAKINMTGWKMWEHGIKDSRITIIEEYPKRTIDGKVQWKCLCNCGKIFIANGKHIRTGNTKSCGCYHKDMASIKNKNRNVKNLIGQKFGKLLVISKAELEIQQKYNTRKVIWKCLCDCGNFTYVVSSNLISGMICSCGCLNISIGENNIMAILKENNINFLFNTSFFKDLIMPGGGYGKYDFIIFNKQNKIIRLIEFDGEQHYNENAAKHLYNNDFNKIKLYDKIKNEYALQHNIPLVRIPYFEKNNINIKMIFSNKYLIKGEK